MQPRPRPPQDMERPPRIGRLTHVWGLPVHYHDVGQGRPVLFLHGNGSLGEEILSFLPDVPGLRCIVPDRPGYGYSAPLPDGHETPLTLAAWIVDFMSALGVRRFGLVAHSLSAGAAICAAGAMDDRIERLLLLAPFCRPTPQHLMPGLRLAVAPVVGPVIRNAIVRPLVPAFRDRILREMVAPNDVPPWLAGFPVRHATRSQAILTMAAELKRFNDGMRTAEPHLRLRQPVTVLAGALDRTAEAGWHLPWLADRAERMDCVMLPHAGHAVHHVAPGVALRLIRSAFLPETASSDPRAEAELWRATA